MKKILLLIAIGVALLIAIRLLPVTEWLRQFQTYVRSLGFSGYLLYFIVYVVCVVLLVPASLLTLGAGAIFGVVRASILISISATIGAAVAFLLAKTVLRGRVEAMVARKPKLRAIDAAIQREGTKLMLLMRISGFPPFTWNNYALGLTGVRFVPYVLTTFFGTIPGTIAICYAGAAGADIATGKGHRLTLIVTAAGAILVAVYVARIATQAMKRAGIDSDMLSDRTEESS